MGYSVYNIRSLNILMLHVPVASLFCIDFLESESEGLKNSKLSHLSAQLDTEKRRAESLKETCRENSVLLQRQTQLYLSVSALSGACSSLTHAVYYT